MILAAVPITARVIAAFGDSQWEVVARSMFEAAHADLTFGEWHPSGLRDFPWRRVGRLCQPGRSNPPVEVYAELLVEEVEAER